MEAAKNVCTTNGYVDPRAERRERRRGRQKRNAKRQRGSFDVEKFDVKEFCLNCRVFGTSRVFLECDLRIVEFKSWCASNTFPSVLSFHTLHRIFKATHGRPS